MKTVTKILAIAATSAAALCAPVAVGSASAAGPYECDSGDFCLYWQDGFGEPLYSWAGNDGYYADNFFVTGWRVNDNTESAWNNGVAGGADDVRLYSGFGYAGRPSWCMPRGTFIGDLASVGMANTASSHRWVSSCS